MKKLIIMLLAIIVALINGRFNVPPTEPDEVIGTEPAVSVTEPRESPEAVSDEELHPEPEVAEKEPCTAEFVADETEEDYIAVDDGIIQVIIIGEETDTETVDPDKITEYDDDNGSSHGDSSVRDHDPVYVPQGTRPFEEPIDGGCGEEYNVEDLIGEDGLRPGEGIHF